ncbi:hypothetical protein [Halomarina ordinaria]|uniref:Uncharacterized protein n=1 Tax=Halomarina ordinaria TaxID=3033939 RepID=A0ABD5UCW5_9EURY|nr:hypothetical protein [Halomarina sp. PSRA2]
MSVRDGDGSAIGLGRPTSTDRREHRRTRSIRTVLPQVPASNATPDANES